MRYLTPWVKHDVRKKMVFLGGPRQCGKTTLAKDLLAQLGGEYFNWDSDVHRRALLRRAWSDDAKLVVFDELHKLPRWKSWVKGVFDTRPASQQYLVTGSARLDVYRRGGDSLLGRYHHWRLHPFGLDEVPRGMTSAEALRRLLTLGGFPEPFLDGDEREAKRWRRERVDRVLRDDVRDLEGLRNIASLDLFVDSLRSRVGGQVVLANIAIDLQVSQKTLTHWLEVLERMYLVFVVRPFTRGLGRAVQKPPKVYFFDTGDVLGDDGARFENYVATALLKRVHYLSDVTGDDWALHYVRDKEGHEVDFVVTLNGRVEALYEAKVSETQPPKSLLYFAERLQPPQAVVVTRTPVKPSRRGRLVVHDAVAEFLRLPGPPHPR